MAPAGPGPGADRRLRAAAADGGLALHARGRRARSAASSAPSGCAACTGAPSCSPTSRPFEPPERFRAAALAAGLRRSRCLDAGDRRDARALSDSRGVRRPAHRLRHAGDASPRKDELAEVASCWSCAARRCIGSALGRHLVAALRAAHRGPRALIARASIEARGARASRRPTSTCRPSCPASPWARRSRPSCRTIRRGSGRAGGAGALRAVRRRRRQPGRGHGRDGAHLPQDGRRFGPGLAAPEPRGCAGAADGGGGRAGTLSGARASGDPAVAGPGPGLEPDG